MTNLHTPHLLDINLKIIKVPAHIMDSKKNQGKGRKVTCEQASELEEGAGLVRVNEGCFEEIGNSDKGTMREKGILP